MLWTADKPMGVQFNKDKMICHYLTTGIDPARGWLGNCISWLYVLKRSALEARLQFQSKYGKGFLLVNMPGDKDSYLEAWSAAEDLIKNYLAVDGAVFPAGVEVDFKEAGVLEGQYFFTSEQEFRKSIVKVILGQDSTSSADNSNRSTAAVHMEVLEQRVLDDMAAVESTLTSQLIPKIKQLTGVNENDLYEFKFVVSDIEEAIYDKAPAEGSE
jgi:phage gp29-like protein